MSASNCFSSDHLLIMNKSKNVYNNNRFQPTTIFVDYVRKLYILFKYYINDIVYKVNICKVFNHIISVNNIYFDYCDNCQISDKVINYFVCICLKNILSSQNLDTICTLKKGIRTSRKLLILKHM